MAGLSAPRVYGLDAICAAALALGGEQAAQVARRIFPRLSIDMIYARPGQTVADGERLGTVEGFKAVSALFCVVVGTLSAANPALTAVACLTHSDPYGAGWLYAVQGTPTPDFLDVHGYVALLTATIDQLQASRYSDGDVDAAEKPVPSAEPESGDDA